MATLTDRIATHSIVRVQLTAQPANDFVDNRLSTVDPLFTPYAGTSTSASGQIIPATPAKQNKLQDIDSGLQSALQSQSEQFLGAAEPYGRSRDGKGSGALDLVKSSSWADVITQAEIVERQ
jgi:hypothetical protein